MPWEFSKEWKQGKDGKKILNKQYAKTFWNLMKTISPQYKIIRNQAPENNKCKTMHVYN